MPTRSRAPQSTEPAFELADTVRYVAEDSALFAADKDSSFRAWVEVGSAKLCVVTGDNASGKSLFVRVIAARSQLAKILPIAISIRERTGSGSGEMSRFKQTMMFGDESENSTGAGSVAVTSTAFANLKRDEKTLLILDEPELGLADSYAGALGAYIAGEAAKIPDTCAGVVVVTHNKGLVRGLLEASAERPTFVHTGAELGLDAWVNDTTVRSLDELLALPMVGHNRWLHTNKLLKKLSKTD